MTIDKILDLDDREQLGVMASQLADEVIRLRARVKELEKTENVWTKKDQERDDIIHAAYEQDTAKEEVCYTLKK